MGKPLRVLMVEDSEDDVLLTIRALKKGGYEPEYMRVETAQAMRKTLLEKTWDVVLCDYWMPKFNGLAAIALLKETDIDIPLIIVSGAIGEETAAECMRSGAHDYVMKGNLPRLVPAIERELKEAESRIQRKRAEEALRESEERFKKIFEEAPLVGIVIASPSFAFEKANPSFCNMMGYSEDELRSMTFADITHPDHLAQDMENVKKVGRGELPFYQTEKRYINKSGKVLWGNLVVSSIHDRHGALQHYLSMVNDITERREAGQKLQDTLGSLRSAVNTTIQVMVSAVEARDPYTAGHQIRSADLARAIANEMGLPREKIEGIRIAGSIHDIGKLSIPAEILSKPTQLTELEFSLIKEHSWKGYEILKDVESPWALAEIVYQHHERMDGSGYPRNLEGDDILIEARILAVADVVEAMASHRPYRASLGIEKALEEISKNRGILYDPEAVDACLCLCNDKGYKFG